MYNQTRTVCGKQSRGFVKYFPSSPYHLLAQWVGLPTPIKQGREHTNEKWGQRCNRRIWVILNMVERVQTLIKKSGMWRLHVWNLNFVPHGFLNSKSCLGQTTLPEDTSFTPVLEGMNILPLCTDHSFTWETTEVVWPLIKAALGWRCTLKLNLWTLERIWKWTKRLEFKYWFCQYL